MVSSGQISKWAEVTVGEWMIRWIRVGVFKEMAF